jgi:NTE family protein
MPIKHLVISGGGPLGFRYLGALEKLEQEGFWVKDEIESIYGTSIGAVISVFLALKYDWETLNKYIIERPWHDVFKINARQLINVYYKKGLFDKKFAEIIFKPLLEAKDLKLNITFKEFYEYTKIDIHIFAFEVNKYEIAEFSHTTHPDFSLIEAVTMSSSLPGLFKPIIIDNCCYIDGGVMCNYPINQCLRDHNEENEILGIKMVYNKDNDSYGNLTINSETSLLDYTISMFVNSMNYIVNSIKTENIENTVRCYIENSPLSVDTMKETLYKPQVRKELMDLGEKDAIDFLQSRSS